MFHPNIAKNDLGCCNSNICMLQSYVSSVLDVCFKMFNLDVSKVDLGVARVKCPCLVLVIE